MEKVLITGASGFLGSHVVKELAALNQYEIIAVTSGKRKTSFPHGVTVEEVNLLSEEARSSLLRCVKPDIICHFAWVQDNSDYRYSSENLRWLEASISLLRVFVEQGGRCFLFSGSSTEYGEGGGMESEIVRNRVMSMYGATKRAFSSILSEYCTNRKVQYIDARYFTIFGEGDPHEFGAVPESISCFLQDKPFVCKAPNTIRDYIYVDDAARATVALATGNFCGSVNIASGQPRLMRDVFELIANIMDKSELLSFGSDNQPSQILVGDVRVLKEAVGFLPESSFEENMKKTINWWKESMR